MAVLLLSYFIYLILYALVSYAILFHLTRFRVEGDRSGAVFWLYIILSGILIIGSIAFIQPSV